MHSIPCAVRRNSRRCGGSWKAGPACSFQHQFSLVYEELTESVIRAVAQHVQVVVPVGHRTEDAAACAGYRLHGLAVTVWLIMTHVVAVNQIDGPALAGNNDEVRVRSRLGRQ